MWRWWCFFSIDHVTVSKMDMLQLIYTKKKKLFSLFSVTDHTGMVEETLKP